MWSDARRTNRRLVMTSHPIHIVLYQQAVLEVDNQKMRNRIVVARAAIERMLGEVDGDYSERGRLEDMLRGLKVLEAERVSESA